MRFQFRLALALGCTRRELLARLSARELAEWMAYEMLEPFGPPATAYAAGVVASTLGNVNRGKDREPFAPEEFMPQIYRQPADDKARKARQAAAKKRALAGKVRAALLAIPEAERQAPQGGQ